MKNQSVVQHLLGFNEVFDRINRINLRMPQGFRIYIRSEKIWIGGKEDGSTYLHLELIPAKVSELDRPLADGDLDISILPQGMGEEIETGVSRQFVDCVLRGELLNGLWLRVSFNKEYDYLVLLADREAQSLPHLKTTGLEIARMIRLQIPQAVEETLPPKMAVAV